VITYLTGYRAFRKRNDSVRFGQRADRDVESLVKKVVLFILAIVLVALGVLLAAPVLVDWNAYRRDVAAAIVQATGREVTIAGDLDLSILPLPRFTVRRISIASVDGAVERDLLRVGELRIELAVAPLLAGRIAVKSLSLVDPVVTLETTADGRQSWAFAPVEPGRAPDRLAAAISIDTVSVSNGTLAWRAAGVQLRQFRAIEATLRMGDPAGTAQLRASARFQDVPFSLEASIGRLGADDPAFFSAAIDVDRGAGRLSATGQMDWKKRLASGTVRLTSPEAAKLARTLTGSGRGVVPPGSISVESAFIADHDVVTLPEIMLTYGEIRGTGQARLSLGDNPGLTAGLVIGTMNLDQFLAATAGQDTAEARPREASVIASLLGPLTEFAASLELTVRTARWRDGVIRDIGADIRFGSRGIAIDRLAMKLPGGTDVTLSGIETQSKTGPRLEGDLAMISDNLRGTMMWAGVAGEELPPDRLRSLSFTSRIAVTAEAVQLTKISARLDATRMTGAATIVRQTRPSFGLRLDLDRLDLDAYLPEEMRAEGDAGNGNSIAFHKAGQFDANLVLSAGTLSFGGKTASQVFLDARLFDGDILLRKLSVGDLGGAKLAITGAIKDVPGTPVGDLECVLEARDAERFATFMDAYPGPIASRIGRFRLDAHASGTARRAAVSATLALAGGNVEAKGTITDIDSDAAVKLAFVLNHADSDRVLGLLAPKRPYGGIGAMAMSFDLTGTAESLAVRNLDATLGGMKVTGRIDVATGGDRRSAVAALSANGLDLDRLFPSAPEPIEDPLSRVRRGSAHWSRQPVDLSALHDFDLDLSMHTDAIVRGPTRVGGLSVHAVLDNGIMTFDRLSGSLFGGHVEASGEIDTTTPAPRFTATVTGSDLAARNALTALARFDRLEGALAISLNLSATGQTPYELVSTLSGAGALSGTLRAQQHGNEPIPAGAAGDAIAKLLNAFASSPANLSGSFQIADGTIRTSDLRLVDGDARTLTTGAADLADWRIDTTTALRRDNGANAGPELVVGLRGSLDDPEVQLSGPAAIDDEDVAPVPAPSPVTPVEPAAPIPAME